MFGLLSLLRMTSDATVTNGHTKHESSSKKEWIRLNVGGLFGTFFPHFFLIFSVLNCYFHISHLDLNLYFQKLSN